MPHDYIDGLSPRAWGSLGGSSDGLVGRRSIPTGVGQPAFVLKLTTCTKVYPHGRGAAFRCL